MAPDPRVTARVLPVNPAARCCCCRPRPGRPDDWHWVTIGGALDPGETPQEAASGSCSRRPASSLAGRARRPVHLGDPEFSWDGVDYISDSTFFAMPLAATSRSPSTASEPVEVGNVAEARWWTPTGSRGRRRGR